MQKRNIDSSINRHRIAGINPARRPNLWPAWNKKNGIADVRPYLVSLNYYGDSREILRFNPVIISPGGHAGFFRLAHPDKYAVIFV